MTVHVLGNPAARGGSGDVERVVDAVRSAGHDVERIDSGSRAESIERARAAVAAGADRIVTVGGDGMVNIACQAVAGTDTVLGIVPQGTGNDFARATGLLDGDLERHVGRALAEPVPVDAVHTDHGWFASVATIGFSGDVTARANALSWPTGEQRYTVATLLQLPRLRTLDLDVTVDGVAVDACTTMLSVGNTAYFGGGMAICPDARPDDGRLEIVVIGDVGRLRFGTVFPRVFKGGHLRDPNVSVHRGTTVTIAGRGAHGGESLWADGEELGPLPVTLAVVPGAVRLAGAGGTSGIGA